MLKDAKWRHYQIYYVKIDSERFSREEIKDKREEEMNDGVEREEEKDKTVEELKELDLFSKLVYLFL